MNWVTLFIAFGVISVLIVLVAKAAKRSDR